MDVVHIKSESLLAESLPYKVAQLIGATPGPEEPRSHPNYSSLATPEWPRDGFRLKAVHSFNYFIPLPPRSIGPLPRQRTRGKYLGYHWAWRPGLAARHVFIYMQAATCASIPGAVAHMQVSFP